MRKNKMKDRDIVKKYKLKPSDDHADAIASFLKHNLMYKVIIRVEVGNEEIFKKIEKGFKTKAEASNYGKIYIKSYLDHQSPYLRDKSKYYINTEEYIASLTND